MIWLEQWAELYLPVLCKEHLGTDMIRVEDAKAKGDASVVMIRGQPRPGYDLKVTVFVEIEICIEREKDLNAKGSSITNECVLSPRLALSCDTVHAQNATAAWNMPILSTRILG